MAKIYTKTGDSGKTSLFGGIRVDKSHQQVEAYGSVDELTSFIGLIIAHITDPDDIGLLTLVQKDLYEIMAFLAGAKTTPAPDAVSRLEAKIDNLDGALPPLTRFILPQGGVSCSLFHIARTVCRRAERGVVRMKRSARLDKTVLEQSLMYLNRLSDLLFVFARTYEETPEKRT